MLGDVGLFYRRLGKFSELSYGDICVDVSMTR
ncbi:MAG: hypothetical protein ACJASB_002255 [Shewanella psychromarinicola]|jgi:hypothetical protein